MQFNLFKGDRPSNGARNLKDALGATMLKSEGSIYSGRRESCVINWGCTNGEAERLAAIAARAGRKFYNTPAAIQKAVDKLEFHRILSATVPEIMIPWVDNYNAAEALVRQGGRMYARTILNSHSGRGIQLLVSNNDANLQAIQTVRNNDVFPVHNIETDRLTATLADTKLFTQGIVGKRTEYRIHVFGEGVILTQQKRRKEGAEALPGYNSIVRNVASGWIYAVNAVNEDGLAAVHLAATKAVTALGLDFGAVDIVYKHDNRTAYVLEVNTAPGLDEDGSALTAYTEAFKNV